MKIKIAHNLGWIIAAGLAGLYGVEMRRTSKLNKIVDVTTRAAIIQLPELTEKINEIIQKEKNQKNNPESVNTFENFSHNPQNRFSVQIVERR